MVPKKVADRLAAGLKRFQPILAAAKTRDINESDTVVLVTDMLADIFGYEKYGEITSELAIRGTYCDLAIKMDGRFMFLIEVKAIGLDLKELHVKQAVDYAANQGVDWVLLTNGETWRIYRVTFTKPIGNELVCEASVSALSHKRPEDIEVLYTLTREGWTKSALDAFHSRKQALSRFSVAAVVLSDAVVDVIRREMRRLSPDVKLDSEQVREVLTTEVLKRDVLEGDQAAEAARRLARASNRALRAAADRRGATSPTSDGDEGDAAEARTGGE